MGDEPFYRNRGAISSSTGDRRSSSTVARRHSPRAIIRALEESRRRPGRGIAIPDDQMDEGRIRRVIEEHAVAIGDAEYKLRLLALRALPDGAGAHLAIGITGHERTLTLPLNTATLNDEGRLRAVVEHWVKEVVTGHLGEEAEGMG